MHSKWKLNKTNGLRLQPAHQNETKQKKKTKMKNKKKHNKRCDDDLPEHLCVTQNASRLAHSLVCSRLVLKWLERHGIQF